MNVVVFEDAAVTLLGDLVAMRPACDLLIGSQSLVEALTHFGRVHRAVRPHLRCHLAAVGASRMPLWGGPAETEAFEPAASRHGAVCLLVNARVVPSRATLAVLRGLVEAGHRAAVRQAGTIAAAVVHIAADGGGPDRRVIDELLAGAADATAAIDTLQLPEAAATLDLLAAGHEVVAAHERTLEGSLATRLDTGRFHEVRPGLFVADGAHVDDTAVIRRGPVVVETAADVGPFTCLDGPIWIGPAARVHPHTWLRGGTAIGRGCRVGGEVEQSVLEPFANKPHEGFLGHSHVGSWANLAAGTISSNLKASYGPIRLHETVPGGGTRTIDTGRQFLGALVGDLAKTAIHTSLPCGGRIGVAATVGGDVPAHVPAFRNLLVGGAGGRSTVAQAAEALGRMMARRDLAILPADVALLEAVAALAD